MLTEYLLGGVAGLILGYFIRLGQSLITKSTMEARARETTENAKKNAEVIVKDAEIKAKDIMFTKREEFEKETKEKRDELRELERRINKKEDFVDGKVEILERKGNDLKKKEQSLNDRDRDLKNKMNEIGENLEKQKQELLRISNLSQDEARRMVLDKVREDVEDDAAEIVKSTIEKAKDNAEKEASNIIAYAMEKCASEVVGENVISSVELPSEDMKGRVIGRDGRNIRAFEKATGVDLIVDDTPELVVISSFNGVRREVARQALEQLIKDGRIHPGRIEDVVNKVRKTVAKDIKDAGNHVLEELGIHKVHPKIVEYLGALKYRTSYGQNVLQHSLEVAELSGAIAAELGLNEQIARRAGLLHDLGKSIDQENEGTHLEIGARIARKFNEKDEVVNAIEAHHENSIEPSSIYTIIIRAADAISASRPGARRDTLERYIQRMEKLEEVANSFEGVSKAFALQAGREVRVIVSSEQVTDGKTAMMCRDIAKKIEDELTYPGEIKVVVIRETRDTEYAR